ncbi:MAG: DUF3267 domain-containing protein [Armatimonadetes bacterium]|nr:DUF3267 domain-containing protein [Armatimonadota bacterium]NIM23193.1 DUF3267 domain-containing protein [Armatimonadota bacterium]NIM67061.1 DUF3267 domain-containing protein [Armatimonadota bacterium]NIM75595.1 DUF3267 domain-containing protein [Armatimonadota bacterium]NIN05250.1 DUF3267 domain-containing protein [Armatimonadota bacterium]
MIIPGRLIALVTFPGVIVHEIAHQLFCRLCGVAVLDVCYFRFESPAGYVEHEPPRRISQHVLIGIGPFIVNSLLGAFIALPSAVAVLQFEAGTVLDYILVWLGVSIAMHAFPSVADAKSIWQAIWSEGTPTLTRLMVTPVVGLIYLGALGSFLWLDLAYGVVLAVGFPYLLVSLLT